MTEPESTQPAGGDAPASAGPKKDLVAEFKNQPAAEKLLAVAAVVVLVAFIIHNGWNMLFKHIWFPTCAFLSSVIVIALIVLDMLSVKIMEPKLRTYVLVLLAILPALGFVIDLLRSSFPMALMLAGAIAMGLAAVKITTREQIIKQ